MRYHLCLAGALSLSLCGCTSGSANTERREPIAKELTLTLTGL